MLSKARQRGLGELKVVQLNFCCRSEEDRPEHGQARTDVPVRRTGSRCSVGGGASAAYPAHS